METVVVYISLVDKYLYDYVDALFVDPKCVAREYRK